MNSVFTGLYREELQICGGRPNLNYDRFNRHATTTSQDSEGGKTVSYSPFGRKITSQLSTGTDTVLQQKQDGISLTQTTNSNSKSRQRSQNGNSIDGSEQVYYSKDHLAVLALLYGQFLKISLSLPLSRLTGNSNDISIDKDVIYLRNDLSDLSSGEKEIVNELRLALEKLVGKRLIGELELAVEKRRAGEDKSLVRVTLTADKRIQFHIILSPMLSISSESTGYSHNSFEFSQEDERFLGKLGGGGVSGRSTPVVAGLAPLLPALWQRLSEVRGGSKRLATTVLKQGVKIFQHHVQQRVASPLSQVNPGRPVPRPKLAINPGHPVLRPELAVHSRPTSPRVLGAAILQPQISLALQRRILPFNLKVVKYAQRGPGKGESSSGGGQSQSASEGSQKGGKGGGDGGEGGGRGEGERGGEVGGGGETGGGGGGDERRDDEQRPDKGAEEEKKDEESDEEEEKKRKEREKAVEVTDKDHQPQMREQWCLPQLPGSRRHSSAGRVPENEHSPSSLSGVSTLNLRPLVDQQAYVPFPSPAPPLEQHALQSAQSLDSDPSGDTPLPLPPSPSPSALGHPPPIDTQSQQHEEEASSSSGSEAPSFVVLAESIVAAMTLNEGGAPHREQYCVSALPNLPQSSVSTTVPLSPSPPFAGGRLSPLLPFPALNPSQDMQPQVNNPPPPPPGIPHSPPPPEINSSSSEEDARDDMVPGLTSATPNPPHIGTDSEEGAGPIPPGPSPNPEYLIPFHSQVSHSETLSLAPRESPQQRDNHDRTSSSHEDETHSRHLRG